MLTCMSLSLIWRRSAAQVARALTLTITSGSYPSDDDEEPPGDDESCTFRSYTIATGIVVYFVLIYFHLLIYLFTLFTIVYQYSKVYSLEFTTLVNVFTFTCICVNSLLSFTSPFLKKIYMAISDFWYYFRFSSENSNCGKRSLQTRTFDFLIFFKMTRTVTSK